MAMGTKGNTPSTTESTTSKARAVPGGDNAAGRDDPRVANPPGSVVREDDVAMVSRLADGTDAQANKTARVLDAEATKRADRAQFDIIEK